MIGDTNLFFFHSEDCVQLAEAEIMIAEESARRKRRGWEAMLLMLRYGKCLHTHTHTIVPGSVLSLNTCEYIRMAQNQNQQHNNKTTLF
jgi:hypothetical protein